jgi:hypothetical protein
VVPIPEWSASIILLYLLLHIFVSLVEICSQIDLSQYQHHFRFSIPRAVCQKVLRALNWPGRTTLLQDPSAHIYSVLFLLSPYISLVYISPVYISPVYISPVYISLVYISPVYISLVFISPPCLYISPEPWASHSFYTLSSHPRTAGHATSPGTQLQLIRAAGAYLHQTGFTCILVHLRSTQDVCGLYEEVRCKSYDLATVPGAFRTAATPAPNRILSSAKLNWGTRH